MELSVKETFSKALSGDIEGLRPPSIHSTIELTEDQCKLLVKGYDKYVEKMKRKSFDMALSFADPKGSNDTRSMADIKKMLTNDVKQFKITTRELEIGKVNIILIEGGFTENVTGHYASSWLNLSVDIGKKTKMETSLDG